MTDIFDPSSPKDDAAAQPGLANPLAVGGSIVAIVVAAVLTARSVFAGDHAAHVWNVRLFSITLALVCVLAVVRIATRFFGRKLESEPVDADPNSSPMFLDASGRTGSARGVRRHRRVIPAERATTLRTYDGRRVAARILNVSMGGVAVEASLTDVEFSTIVAVGTRPAKPIRRTSIGAVFRFDTLLDPVEFDRGLIL